MESNPEEFIKHILRFDNDVVSNLCIRLNNLHNEKIYMQMMMMQQYYSQQYYMMHSNNSNNK